ncbi:MAG: hypothetical protein E7K72_24440 [Roseomonas mucosa]|nr:hypothetical protein [Roseomonas mucosa]
MTRRLAEACSGAALLCSGVALLCGALSGCDMPRPDKPSAVPVEEPAGPDLVRLVATAPDGTRLWVIWHRGQRVYFASSGTETTRNEGKRIVEEVVPTARKSWR